MMTMNNSPYHMVTNSPWPIILSINLMNLFLSNLFMFNNKNLYFMFYMILTIFIYMMLWWNNITQESTLQGSHSKKCKFMIKFAMILFIISEVMFFISMFWCYFHTFLSPNIELGSNWPPLNINLFNPFSMPMINTLILLSSGITLTYSHNLMLNNNFYKSYFLMFMTINLGILFTIFQMMEYIASSFSMSDSIFGSIFFMLTGFHGLHVIIGTMFLINVSFMMKNQYSKINHLSYELSSWYWHFVDVIWLMLYLSIYWWPY